MILGKYLSKIKKGLLLLFLRWDGRLHLLILCCAPNRKKAASLVGGSGAYQVISIDADGRPGPAPEEAGNKGFLYYSFIQFAGSIEPKSGRAGIDLLPGTVIYNGMEESFLQSFAHFRDHLRLHIFSAVYFQPHSTLSVHENVVKVGGRGHISVIRASGMNPEGRDFEVSQFAPGDTVAWAEVGLKAKNKA